MHDRDIWDVQEWMSPEIADFIKDLARDNEMKERLVKLNKKLLLQCQRFEAENKMLRKALALKMRKQ